MLLHGEHYIETLDPIKNGDELISTPEVVKVEEKGKGTVVTVRVTTRDQTGNIKCINEGTTFNRGAHPRHNIASKKDLKAFEFNSEWMASAPNYIVKDTVPLTQAAIYRLSGDQNPLHMYLRHYLQLVIRPLHLWQDLRNRFYTDYAPLVLLLGM